MSSLKRKYGASAFKVPGKKMVVAGVGQRNRVPRIKGAIKKVNELKYIDSALLTLGCNTSGFIQPINLCAVGDDNTDRDGRQITVKSVALHGIVNPTDDTSAYCKARVLLVWDNACNGATPAITDIMTAISGTSFPLVNNQNRFTILMDRSYAVGKVDTTATSAIAASQTCFDVNAFIRINSTTQYSGTTATIASVQNGALYLVTMGSEPVATGCSFRVQTRVRFTDD